MRARSVSGPTTTSTVPHTLIIATGASAKWLGLLSERRLVGHGVSSCATCDGAFFKGRPIAVIGGGDTAMEEALFLTRFASKVTVVHRRDKLRASKVMQDKAFANPKIEFLWNSEIDEILDVTRARSPASWSKNLVTGARVTSSMSTACSSRSATRRTRRSSRIISTLNPNGYIVTKGTHTSVEGVFAAGDVQDYTYRQAITAAGTGCMAAMDAERYLENMEFDAHEAANEQPSAVTSSYVGPSFSSGDTPRGCPS